MTENLPERGRKTKLSLRTVRKLCREVNINLRAVLKDIAKSLDAMGINVSTRIIQCCLYRNRLCGKRPRRTSLHKP